MGEYSMDNYKTNDSNIINQNQKTNDNIIHSKQETLQKTKTIENNVQTKTLNLDTQSQKTPEINTQPKTHDQNQNTKNHENNQNHDKNNQKSGLYCPEGRYKRSFKVLKRH